MFKTWGKVHHVEWDDAKNIYHQIIWHDSFITVDVNPVKYSNWDGCNINFIQDLVNKDGKIKEKHNIMCLLLE